MSSFLDSSGNTASNSLLLAYLADIDKQSGKCLLANPERELFYFSLLLGRKEMAIQFWRYGKDHIGGALTASVLCRNLAQIAENEEELDLCQELESNAQ